MKKEFILSIVLWIFCCSLVWGQEKPSRNLLNKMVLVKIDDQRTNASGMGSGFILKKDTSFFLVTALHVVDHSIFPYTNFFLLNSSNKIVAINLLLALNNPSRDIKFDNRVDVCIIRLKPYSAEVLQALQWCAFNWTSLTLDKQQSKKVERRDCELLSMGFPLYDADRYAPMTNRSNLASGLVGIHLVELPKSNFLVYYSDKPNMQGISGGPVFIDVKKIHDVNLKKIKILGIAAATSKDNTGGKLGAITPASYILDLLKYF